MRVLLVNKYARVTGGADRHVLDLAAVLRGRGHDVRLLSTEGTETDVAGAFIPPTVTHWNRDQMQPAQRLRVANMALWNRTAASAIRRLLSEFDPDLVHAHKLYPQLSVAPVVVAHEAGIPIVQSAHDYEFISA